MRLSPKDAALGALLVAGLASLAITCTLIALGFRSVFVSTPQPVFRPTVSADCPVPAGVIDNLPKKHRVVWL